MTLQQFKSAVLSRMGLDGTITDDFFTEDILNQVANEAHREVAADAPLYSKLLCLNIPVAESGRSVVPIPRYFLRMRGPNSVRWNNGGTYTTLREYSEAHLEELGPLENLSTSGQGCAGYVLRASDGSDVAYPMELWIIPGVSTAIGGGLHADAWIYPDWMEADDDTFGFEPALHSYLIPIACRILTERNTERGSTIATLPYWNAQAERGKLLIRTAVQRARRGGSRSIHMVW